MCSNYMIIRIIRVRVTWVQLYSFRQFLFSGQTPLQLHGESSDLLGGEIFLLWALMICSIFSVQLKLTFTVFRLQILWSLLLLGKCLSISLRNVFAIFVCTFLIEWWVDPNNIPFPLFSRLVVVLIDVIINFIFQFCFAPWFIVSK